MRAELCPALKLYHGTSTVPPQVKHYRNLSCMYVCTVQYLVERFEAGPARLHPSLP